MPFSKAQQQAIDLRGKNILVSASAGSGKTSVLVERLCKLVLVDKISIDRILAMTFTEDAANEMKDRLKKRLQEKPQTDYIQSQLALLETASICTIDGFCLSIVKNYYYKVPISYTMSKSVASSAQTNKAFLDAYNEACNNLDTKDFVKLKLFFNALGKTEDDILSSIRDLINVAMSKPDSTQWILSLMNKPCSQETYNWFFQYFIEQIESMIEICKNMKEADNQLFTLKEEYLNTCLESLHKHDYVSFKKQFEIYFNSTPGFKKTINKISYEKEQGAFKKIEGNILNVLYEKEEYDQDLNNNIERINTFCTLSLLTMEIFAKKKADMEIIDFTDMEHFAYKLLKQPMIQEEVRNKYQMILVDEFQDTNELQENIIQCFARKDNVFRVGDIKQSIYGFRQARPEIMQGHMDKKDENSCLIVLDENYRSNQSIVEFNNEFYAHIMNTSLLGQNFRQDDIAKVGTARQKDSEQHPVRFLYTEYLSWIENQEESFNKIQAKSLHKNNVYDLIANDILTKHEQGIPYSSICILTRTHSPQEELKKVLETYEIPLLAEIDHGFYTNHAIQIVLSTLISLNDPSDDIALMASLCSPIGNVSSNDIASCCLDKEKNVSLYSLVKDKPFIESWKQLRQYKNEPISDLIRHIYGHNDFYFNYTTNQDKTNLDQFLEMASQFEEQNDLNLFLEQIINDSNQDAVGEAYPYGKDADVVKIKTMHHSKGLQFPIIYILSSHETKDKYSGNPVLVDPVLGISLNALDSSLKFKRTSLSHLSFVTKKNHDDLREEMRVFYVATTRAEKELVIVDYLDDINNYASCLNTSSLLEKSSYTGWLLHTYLNKSSSLFKLDKKNQLYKRPLPRKKDDDIEISQVYQGIISSISGQTASAAKQSSEWPVIDLNKNISTSRGTLFHEIVANCAYPYQKEDCIHYASKHHFTLQATDIKQLLSLNECPAYKEMLQNKHEFECSYITRENEKIIHGFIDLIAWLPDHICILDFKTDTVQSENELIDKYHSQLDTYKKAIHTIEPNKKIKTYIYSFHLMKIISLD